MHFVSKVLWLSRWPLLLKLSLVLLLTLLVVLGTICFLLVGNLAFTFVFWFLCPVYFAEAWFLSLFLPFVMIWWVWRISWSLEEEKRIIDFAGRAEALWWDSPDVGIPIKRTCRAVVMSGWDSTSGVFAQWLSDAGFGGEAVTVLGEQGWHGLSSVLWSYFVEALHWASCHSPPEVAVLAAWHILRQWRIFGSVKTTLSKAVKWIVLSYMFLLFMDGRRLSRVVALLCLAFSSLTDPMLVEYAKWWVTARVVQATVFLVDMQMVGVKFSSKRTFRSDLAAKRFSAAMRATLMQFSVMVTDIGLPHYIRGGKIAPSKENLQESLQILKDLGWPVNVELTDPDWEMPEKLGYKEWVFSGTDWKQGIHHLKTYTDDALDKLRINAVEFRRTEEYASVENELNATARYFKSPQYDYPDLELDDVWFMVKDTFIHSRLTPFNHVIAMWEKRYGLGSFMRKPGSRSKYQRARFIRDIGGMKAFKQLWRRTFEYATLIVPVSAVSVKGEALPPKKWLNDKVRSIIGTPLVHYIMSTVWNYEPNHRFAWTTTPTKIGMPLNGYWMADVYHRHSRCQHHFAGDMSDFDSTISGKVKDVIKAVRKKGFENHKDVDRICELIDVAYAQIDHQLLNTTSTGNIYYKGTGLTTGHSSTSMDNSLALLTLYLMAWKQLTGLGAKEFKHFNELSDYGDDHILSMLASKPAAWNFKNIQKTMARWGVTNRLEATGRLDKIPFLSKFSRKVNNEDRMTFRRLGLPVPQRIVYHDKEKLVGKMVARVKNFDPAYRVKRLISYMQLTAHHEDVYTGIKTVLERSSTLRRAMRKMTVKVPTYQEVMASWYNPKAHFPRDVHQDISDESESRGLMFKYGQVGWWDSFTGTLALVPDFLNPAIFNFGYSKMIQLNFRRFLEWPVAFISYQNGLMSQAELVSAFRQCGYEAIDPTVHSLVESEMHPAGFLLRHWLFCWYKAGQLRASPASFIEALTRKINNTQFLLNGKINPSVTRYNLFVLDLIVIGLLNLVPCVPWLGLIGRVVLPRFDFFLDGVIQAFVVGIWSNIPPNYHDVTHVIRNLDVLQKPLLITAPTGTGKSTTLIRHLELVVGANYHKIIVVQPRSELVRRTVPFVTESLGMDASGLTSSLHLDRRCKVWYVTPQEVSLHWNEMMNPHNLIVLDEAHILEPFYVLIHDFLAQARLPTVMVTATPSERNEAAAGMVVPLTIASLWEIGVFEHKLTTPDVHGLYQEYQDKALSIIMGSWSRSKILVFYPSIKGSKAFGERVPRKVSYLNSKEQDTSGDVIISTSVADAGLTIPSVDVVISPNFDIFVPAKGKPHLVKLSNGALEQRKGRTGRTNNGTFHKVVTPLDLPMQAHLLTEANNVVPHWLTFGIPVEVLDSLQRARILDWLHLPPDTTLDSSEVYRAFLHNIKRFRDNFEYFLANRMKVEEESLIPDPVIFDYTAAGEFSASTALSVDEVRMLALNQALDATKLQFGHAVDAEAFVASFRQAAKIPATKAPHGSLFESDLSGLLTEEDGYERELYLLLKKS